MMHLSESEEILADTFFSFARKEQDRVAKDKVRFVHYTSAQAAMSIIRSKAVWMRNASCMNDFMEVQHGLDCLIEFYRDDAGKTFKSALDGVFSGISGKFEKLFNGWIPSIQTETYITCLSEHLKSEDTFGRLSMWRAYGKEGNVAIVLNNAPFMGSSDTLKAYSSPVAYLSVSGVKLEFEKATKLIRKNTELLRSKGEDQLLAYLFQMFKFAAVCIKHPGFSEEREWRIVYWPEIDSSDWLRKEIVSLGGIPQPVYSIPLSNIPDEGIVGVAIPELVDRIIIGPTQYPSAMCRAFQGLLAEAGMSDSASRVFVSDIPLR